MSRSINSNLLKIVQKNFPQIAEKGLQEEIATVGTLMQFGAGTVIMDYGSYVKLVPLIVSGSIKVTREDEEEGREMLLYFLGAGETCSMSFTCCMMNKQSAIRTEAIEDTSLVGVPIQYIDSWMNKYQSWKNFIMLNYDQKMMELVRVIDNIAFESMDNRLKKYLRARTKSTRSNIIQATHSEIAADLNASREAVSRLLKKLENQGVVALARNQVEIL